MSQDHLYPANSMNPSILRFVAFSIPLRRQVTKDKDMADLTPTFSSRLIPLSSRLSCDDAFLAEEKLLSWGVTHSASAACLSRFPDQPCNVTSPVHGPGLGPRD
jgi:hypothetical protein